MTIWALPIAILITTTILAFPLSRYLAWIMDGKYRAPRALRWFEDRLNSGTQDWKLYVGSMLVFNTLLFIFWLSGSCPSTVDAAQWGRQGDAGAVHHLSQCRLVYDEYRPPALLGRPNISQTSARFSSGCRISSSPRRSVSAGLWRSSGRSGVTRTWGISSWICGA